MIVKHSKELQKNMGVIIFSILPQPYKKVIIVILNVVVLIKQCLVSFSKSFIIKMLINKNYVKTI